MLEREGIGECGVGIGWEAMGCTWSGLDALVGAVGSGAEVWVNKRRFRIQRQPGEGGFAFVYLVREQLTEQQQWKDAKDPCHASGALNHKCHLCFLRSCCIFFVSNSSIIRRCIWYSISNRFLRGREDFFCISLGMAILV